MIDRSTAEALALSELDFAALSAVFLRFTECGADVSLSANGAVAKNTAEEMYLQSAVCAEAQMTGGVHFCEVRVIEEGGGNSLVGIIGSDFDATGMHDGAMIPEVGWVTFNHGSQKR